MMKLISSTKMIKMTVTAVVTTTMMCDDDDYNDSEYINFVFFTDDGDAYFQITHVFCVEGITHASAKFN